MQNFKEKQEEIRKPSSVISVKKQRKTIEWNGKDQRSLQEIRAIKGTFHAKMGTIKDRNGMDVTEAEDVKKWWQENTELYKKRSS